MTPNPVTAMQVLFLGKLLRGLFGGGRTLTAAEAKRLIDENPGVIVVDVRQDGEFRGGHIPKAKHVPVGLIAKRAEKLDPQATYVLYCLSGARSGRAARVLSAKGFRNVFNLHGGIGAWQRAGYSVSRK